MRIKKKLLKNTKKMNQILVLFIKNLKGNLSENLFMQTS